MDVKILPEFDSSENSLPVCSFDTPISWFLLLHYSKSLKKAIQVFLKAASTSTTSGVYILKNDYIVDFFQRYLCFHMGLITMILFKDKKNSFTSALEKLKTIWNPDVKNLSKEFEELLKGLGSVNDPLLITKLENFLKLFEDYNKSIEILPKEIYVYVNNEIIKIYKKFIDELKPK